MHPYTHTHTDSTLSRTNVWVCTPEHKPAATEVFVRNEEGKKERGEKRERECCSGRLNPSCRITV